MGLLDPGQYEPTQQMLVETCRDKKEKVEVKDTCRTKTLCTGSGRTVVAYSRRAVRTGRPL